MLDDELRLGRVHEGTLHAYHILALIEEHIPATDQLVGSWRIEHGAGVDHGEDLEGNTRWEVRLDEPGDDIGRRALRGDDHVYPRGARLLRQTGDGLLHLLANGHHQIGELVHDEHDVGHQLVPIQAAKLARAYLLVVLLDVAHGAACRLELAVAVVHLDAERIERSHHPTHVGDDSLVGVGQLG